MREQELERYSKIQPTTREQEVLSKGKCRRRMPPVGIKKIFHPKESAFLEKPTEGTVIYVNWKHMYYTVRYDNGLTENYTPVFGDAYRTNDDKYNHNSRRTLANERH